MSQALQETTAPVEEAQMHLAAMGIDARRLVQDRYRVIGVLGVGGNGMVLRAFDLKLRREVAIKTVRIGRDRRSDRASDRLVREAVTLAQLRHPSIVQVFDVDRIRSSGQSTVWVVMEIVEGPTLHSWLEDDEHTVQEVLRVFIQAGAGLEAAHREGILHRDFKPRNVVVARDGRVRVLDFGLARLFEEQTSDDPVPGPRRVSRLSGQLTESGFVVGTPAFMAPEQFEGRTLPHSDQYSFCKSLAAGLYCGGHSPRMELIDRLRAKPSSVTSPRGRVPLRVARAVSRGLAADPEDRHPSMSALLECIDPRPRYRGWWWALPAAATAGVGAWLGVGGGGQPLPCGDGESKLEEVWGEQQRRDVQATVEGLGVRYGDRAWRDIESALDEYGRGWLERYDHTCESIRLDGVGGPDSDLEFACLHRARLKLGVVAGMLAHGDADVLARAHVVLEALVPLTMCADAETLRRGGPPSPPPRLASEVSRIRAAIDRCETARLAGREEEARSALVASQDSGALAEYPPVANELAFERGMLAVSGGEFREAQRLLQGVLRSTLQTGQRELAVRAATILTNTSGVELAQSGVGRSYERVARGLVETVESPRRSRAALLEQGASLLREEGRYTEALTHLEAAREELAAESAQESREAVDLDVAISGILLELGRQDEAVSGLRRTLEVHERLLGPMHPDLATTRGALAAGLGDQGKFYEAEAQWRVALSIRTLALGERHHLTAYARRNLGVALFRMGRAAEANVEATAALEVMLEVYGELHPDVASTRTTVAATLYGVSRIDEAIAQFERSARDRLALLGEGHADVGDAYFNLTTVYMAHGRAPEALEAIDRAIAIYARAHGWNNSNMGSALMQRGECLQILGRYPEAASPYERSLSIQRATLGDDHVYTADTASRYASLLLTLGQPQRALELAEAAWAVHESNHMRLGVRTYTAFTLARALWADGQRERARKLAWIAADVPQDVTLQSEAEQWLRQHGGRRG